MQKKKIKIGVQGYVKSMLKMCALGYLFFRNTGIAIGIGFIAGFWGIRSEQIRQRKKENDEITMQFREGLQGLSSALGAGYSIENAFEEARKDLLLLYGKDSVLEREFHWITQQLSLNMSVEKVLFDFANRWESEDILHFAQVFQTAKRTGGDLIAITRSTGEKISQKIEVQREIQSLIAGKEMEGKIMTVIPLGIIVYFWICSPGFLDPFYHGSGYLVSAVLMIVYLLSDFWSRKICCIHI